MARTPERLCWGSEDAQWRVVQTEGLGDNRRLAILIGDSAHARIRLVGLSCDVVDPRLLVYVLRRLDTRIL